jgi:thioredoxin-dependent peroxiredoxin
MKLEKNQSAPEFIIRDVAGNTISLNSLRGQKVYLAFMRFAGCPVCNLRVHSLLKQAEDFKKRNIKVLLVYESSPEIMREYLAGEEYPFSFIADPKDILYTLYSVETSWLKIMAGMFRGAMGKFFAGNKLYKKKIAMDGKQDRLEAEFMIDEKGQLSLVHYSNFLGDTLPVEEILMR